MAYYPDPPSRLRALLRSAYGLPPAAARLGWQRIKNLSTAARDAVPDFLAGLPVSPLGEMGPDVGDVGEALWGFTGEPAVETIDELLGNAPARDPLESLMPATVPLVGARRVMPDLRAMGPERAVEAARRGEHLIEGSTGYVGAPRTVTTPEELEWMRAAYDDRVRTGAKGRDWYERVKQWISGLTSDPVKQDALAQKLAITSPRSDQQTNLFFAMRAKDQAALGEPVKKMRYPWQAKTLTEAFSRGLGEVPGVEAVAGPKIYPYGRSMNPTVTSTGFPTNDFRQARGFGYTTRSGKPWEEGLGPTQHTFADAETMLAVDRANDMAVGGFTDWDVEKIQAASWVTQKAEDLFSRGGYATFDDALDDALREYSEFTEKHTLNMTSELYPGKNTGVLQGIEGADPWTLDTFKDRLRRIMQDEEGRDVLARVQFSYSRPDIPGTGAWQPEGAPFETNPLLVARPVVSVRAGTGDISPEAERLGGAVQYFRSGLTGQTAGGASIINTGRPESGHRALLLGEGQQHTPEQIQKLYKVAEPFGLQPINYGTRGTALVPAAQLGGEGGPKNAGELGRILRGTKKRVGLAQVLEGELPGVTAGAQRARYSGIYEPTGLEAGYGSGAFTSGLFQRMETDPMAFKFLDDPQVKQRYGQELLQFLEDYQRLGFPTRDDLLNFVREYAKGGIQAVYAAWRSGKVPLPVIGAMLGGGSIAAAFTQDEPSY